MTTVQEAEAAIDRINELLESEEIEGVWDKAPDFFESIQESLGDMAETIERTGEVTVKQATALANWEEGIRKWIH